MHLVINAECDFVPEKAKLLTSEGNPLLNLLLSLDYDPFDPPYADLLKQYHQLDGDDWLVLSPIRWQATHNDAIIIASGKDLHLEENEAKLWFHLFSEYLAEEGKVLYYHNKETWLLSHNTKCLLHSKPVHHLLHQSLMPELAQLDQTMYWQRFITESQMFFASGLNQSAINGVWLWGSAKLKDKKTKIICADEQLLTIAQTCSSNVTLYQPSLRLREYQILLISNLSVLSTAHQKELKKRTIHWYWNNTAYILRAATIYDFFLALFAPMR